MEKNVATELDKKPLTPEQGLALAERVPGLLRHQLSIMPDASESFDKRIKDLGKIAKVTGLSMGAVFGAASFTKLIPGKWKWVTGATAVGSGAFGLIADYQAGKAGKIFKHGIAEANKEFLRFADDLENNESLRKQLADYFVKNTTAKDIATIEVGKLVVSNAILFAQSKDYFNVHSITEKLERKLRCEKNPSRSECAIAR